MWSTLDRTRRRIMRFGTSTVPVGQETPSALDVGARVEPPGAIMIAIGRPELDRLGVALQSLLGPDVARPDTPDRLDAALSAAVTHLGGVAQLRVNRRPAGLYTPEAWQVHIETADPTIVDAIRQAIREGVFAA